MATIYLRSSDGDDGDDGSTWALAKLTWQAAATAAGVDGTVIMDEDHRETFGDSKTFTMPAGLKTVVVQTGTTTLVTSPNATANIECTTGNDDLIINGVQIYSYGLSLKTTREIRSQTNDSALKFENSRVITTSSSGFIGVENDGGTLCLIDCEVSTYGFHVSRGGLVSLRGCTYEVTASAPTTLFQLGAEGGRFHIDSNDFSAYDGTNIFNFAQITSANQGVSVQFTNNRMPSGAISWSAGRPTIISSEDWLKCHANGNGSEYYQIFEDNYGGYVQESVAIDRVGGATYDGTNLFSIGLHGNANTSYVTPIRHKLRIKPIDATSGATVKVHLAYDKGTTLNNSDIGLEVKYHDGTNEAHGKWVREIALGPLDSGDRDGFTDVSGSETWNESFGDPNEETIEVDIPASADGLVEVWVVLMSNETVYFCPEPEVT